MLSELNLRGAGITERETRPTLFSKLSVAEEGDGEYDKSHAYHSNSALGPTNPGPMLATVKRDDSDNPQ
jgi:hypothetical protein